VAGFDLGASWAHHNRCDGRVIIQRVPVRELTRETVGALDGLGGKVGRTIQCHQELIPEDPETVEQVMLGKALKDGTKDGVEMAWSDRSEEGADVEGVSDLLITCQTDTPNSYRLMKRPITRSRMVVVLAQQIVRRTNRLIRVRKLMCCLSIFCVFAFPTVCCSAATCRS
jgi:hypothetical protein